MDTILSKVFLALKQRSVQTILTLAVYVLLAPFLPPVVHQIFYTISLFIKDLLIWNMPLVVALFIAHTVSSFERRAPLFILTLVLFETLSNLSSVWYAFGAATLVADQLPLIKATTLESDFVSLWRLPLSRPSWWSADKGAFAGLLLGCISAFNKNLLLRQVLSQGKSLAEWLLTKVFARLIPIFVLGFAAHMIQTKILTHVFAHYAVLTMCLSVFIMCYLVFLFSLGAGWSVRAILQNIRNLLPAGGMALTSSCSMSTMPWTIEGASKNLQNPMLAKAIIPATTNIQQIGDCIAQTFLCFMIYRHFYGHNPDLMTWISFSTVFVLARFATAAVLGGAIFIMLPIYESYLGFTPEMIAIILALNVVLDPLITSSNVMANGALCRVFEKVWTRVQARFAPTPGGYMPVTGNYGEDNERVAKTDRA
jgi:Na+/H+-dicarboxylate symporter